MTYVKKKKRNAELQKMVPLSSTATKPAENKSQPQPQQLSPSPANSSSTSHSLASPSSCYSSTTTPCSSSSSSASSRYDSSLSLLTKRFINFMISTQGDIDLKQAAILLKVQKRRIYDITNVLEGIHLIEKVSKNHVRWIGDRHNKQDKHTATKNAHKSKLQQQQQQQQQQKKKHEQQLHQQRQRDKLLELQKANRELELEHGKLIQLEENIKQCTAHTLQHPQCHLLKHDLELFLQDLQQERSPSTSESSSSLSSSSGQQLPFSPSTSLFLPPLLQRHQKDDLQPYHHSPPLRNNNITTRSSVFIPKQL